MDVEQIIYIMAVRHQFIMRKSLTQSKKKSSAAMRKEINL